MLLLAVLISMFSATDDLPEKWDYMLEYFPNGVYESISFTDYEEMGKSELYRLDKELRKDLEVPERLKGSIPKELSSRFIRVLSGRLMRLEINERKVHKIIKEVEEFVSGNDIKPGRAKYPKGSSEKEKRVIDSAMKKMAKSKSQFDETISAMFAGMSRIIVAEVADKEELLKILKEKALIKDVGKEKQLEGYDVYKLKSIDPKMPAKPISSPF